MALFERFVEEGTRGYFIAVIPNRNYNNKNLQNGLAAVITTLPLNPLFKGLPCLQQKNTFDKIYQHELQTF